MALAIGARGLGVGAGSGFLLSVLMRDQSSGWGDLVGAVLGMLIFAPAGKILALIIFKIRHYRGSSMLGIPGVVIGEFLAFSLSHLLLVRMDSVGLIFDFLAPAPVLGAMGYHLGRGKGLLRLCNGKCYVI